MLGAPAPAESPSGPRPFSWSASRHDTFATCRRRYYYAYYAALEDDEIRRLKKLSALPLWAGSVVHEAIESFLRTSDALPAPEEQEALVRSAVHSGMLADWRESEAGSLRFRLFEHEYEVPVEQEDKRLAVTTVMRSLRNFFRTETLRRALAVGRSQWLALEDLVSFHVGDVEVFLRMDLAYRDGDGRVVIVDWKTGRGEGRFNEVQVAGYALYAAEKGWVGEAEEISTELSYLVIPKAVRRAVTGRMVQHARNFIARSARDMRALLVDPASNLARLEDFPMCDRPQVCRRCNFRRLCFPREADARPRAVLEAGVRTGNAAPLASADGGPRVRRKDQGPRDPHQPGGSLG
jgi:CRISPR/Cas system-associated exonuclease Cas4 (RecB family)